MGVNLAALVAGVSVFGVAVGLGAQSLIKDFLSGIFILLEDQYGVGDTIVLNSTTGTTGTVENVTLRTTRLRSAQGTVWHVPNSQITMVGNESQLWSRAIVDVEIAHDAEIAAARPCSRPWPAVCATGRRRARGSRRGRTGAERDGVSLRVTVKTVPSQQWRISRELRERIKLAFDDQGSPPGRLARRRPAPGGDEVGDPHELDARAAVRLARAARARRSPASRPR